MSPDVALALFERLLRARRFDEHLLSAADEIRGHWHSSIGMEATGAALGMLREGDDRVMTTYRNHAHLAGLGANLATMFAEILGRDAPPQRGRSGSLHLIAPEFGVLHTSAMVSAGAPLSCGLAYALAKNGRGIVFCFFGDGAVNEGGIHESLNLAALWQLPILFVCENNAPPAKGHANDMQAAATLGAIAEVNQVPATTCDGRDPSAVLNAMSASAKEVRAGGPRFVEVRVPVWPGNRAFFPFDATGATDLALATTSAGDAWADRDDPVQNLSRELLESGIDLDVLLEVDQRVTSEAASALDHARGLPRPPAEVATADVVSGR